MDNAARVARAKQAAKLRKQIQQALKGQAVAMPAAFTQTGIFPAFNPFKGL